MKRFRPKEEKDNHSISEASTGQKNRSNQERIQQLQGQNQNELSDIERIQTRLNELGFDCGPVDGLWGRNTRRAVIAFQRTNNLAPDGIVGLMTSEALGLPGVTGGWFSAPSKGEKKKEANPPEESSNTSEMPSDLPPGLDGRPGEEKYTPNGRIDIRQGDKMYTLKQTDDGKTGQFGKILGGISIGRNIYGPVYLAANANVRIMNGLSSSENKNSAKINAYATVAGRLGLGKSEGVGKNFSEFGVGGQLNGTAMIPMLNSSIDSSGNISFSGGEGFITVGVSAYFSIWAKNLGARISLPLSKNYRLVSLKVGDSTYPNLEMTEGPDMPIFCEDVKSMLLELSKKGGLAVAIDQVEEKGKELLDDGISIAASGNTAEEREREQSRLMSSWEEFLSWWRGRREDLKIRGVPAKERNHIFDTYVQGWNAANPNSLSQEPNLDAAQRFQAEARQLEATALEAARKRAKQKQPQSGGLKNTPLPPAIRGEVKHRVKNHQMSGSIPYAGVTYTFQYDNASARPDILKSQ